MTQQLFGQFLLERGRITRSQLLLGLKRQRDATPLLGDLAVDAGWLSEPQARRINMLQRNKDEQFGILCLREGLLTEEQLTELLDQQSAQRRSLGMALVDLGILDKATVEAEMLVQEQEEGPGPCERPSFVLKDAMETDIARWLVSVLSTQYLRMTQEPIGFKRLSPPSSKLSIGGVVASQAFSIHGPYDVIIGMTEDIAAEIGTRYLEETTKMPDPLCADAVKEFLNIIVGHLIGHITPAGSEATARPPKLLEPNDIGALESVAFHGILDAGGREMDVLLVRG